MPGLEPHRELAPALSAHETGHHQINPLINGQMQRGHRSLRTSDLRRHSPREKTTCDRTEPPEGQEEKFALRAEDEFELLRTLYTSTS